MDMLLANFRDVFVFINYILNITKGTKIGDLDNVREILKSLDEADYNSRRESAESQ